MTHRTKAELARRARVSRRTFYKHLRVLLTDPEAKKKLLPYNRNLGYTPDQVAFIAKNLPQFNL